MKSIDDTKDMLYPIEEQEFNTMDVRSIYHAYKNRLSCSSLNQYAINKTKMEFNKMVERFNTFDTINILNLYLLMNGMILDITISKNDLDPHYRFYDAGGLDYFYEDYVNDTQYFRDQLIVEINNKINQFI
jgi:hypothetical protein